MYYNLCRREFLLIRHFFEMKRFLFCLVTCLLAIGSTLAEKRSFEITGCVVTVNDDSYRFVYTIEGEVVDMCFIPTTIDPVPRVYRSNLNGFPNETEIQDAVVNCEASVQPYHVDLPQMNKYFDYSFVFCHDGIMERHKGSGIIPGLVD